MARSRRSRRFKLFAIIGGILLVGIVIVGAWAFPTVRDLTGFLQSDNSERTYNGDTVQDLKAIRTALMLYHESEGAFPPADHWMESIRQHMRTSDMSPAEAMKKLIDPAFKDQPDRFGFALNDAVAAKYKGDIRDQKTPLVFESSDGSRDAHGSPDKLAPQPPHKGGDLAIAVDGTILKLQG